MPSDTLFSIDHLDANQIRFVEIGGIRTRLWEGGKGEPLVLVHGGQFGDLYSLDSWSLNLTELAETFHVFTFDRLGQGFTDNPDAHDGYTVDAVMEHVIAFVKEIAPSPVHLVGHSRGGFLAMWLAFEHPDLARTVTIVDSNTAAPDNPDLPSDRFYKALDQRIPGPPSPDTVHIEPEWQSYSPDHVTSDFVNRRREIASLPKLRDAYLGEETGRQAVWNTGLNVKRQETLDRVIRSGMPMPVLVAWGHDDPSAPLPLGIDLFQQLCTQSETVQLHVINRAGHYVFREHPRLFNALLRSFCLRS